jgi:hypothetical protein
MNGFSVVLKLAGWIVAVQLGHRCYDRWSKWNSICMYVKSESFCWSVRSYCTTGDCSAEHHCMNILVLVMLIILVVVAVAVVEQF